MCNFITLTLHVHPGGKRCPICNQRISHEKWNISPSVAEERWAHEQAKKREIAEVVDFLGL